MPVHPLQLYFAAAGVATGLLLLRFRLRKRYDGELALLFVLLFAASSAVLERFRDEPGAGSALLWPASVTAVAAAVALAVAELRHRSRHAPAAG